MSTSSWLGLRVLTGRTDLPGHRRWDGWPSGVIEAVVDLSARQSRPADSSSPPRVPSPWASADLTTTLNFENSDNVTHLLVGGFTGSDGDDLDTNDDGVLDVIPWFAELDRIALVEEANPPAGTEYHYGPPSIGPDGVFVPCSSFHLPLLVGSWASSIPPPAMTPPARPILRHHRHHHHREADDPRWQLTELRLRR